MRPSLNPLWSVLAAALALSACKRPEPAATGPATPAGRPLTGQILSVDTERGTLLVDHDEIPGYMPPMAMEFHVNAGDLANAREGQRIRGELFEGDDGDFRLEKIWPLDPLADTRVTQAAGRLREDTTIRGRGAYREIGENLPDFALYNQDGQVVDIARYRGRFVLMNFIYTRCPIATMCPAATMNMMRTQDAAKQAGRTDLELISITFDPEFDTPGVLQEYARARGIDTTNFTFLTGPERAIKDLLTQFGVHTQFDGNMIQHTLATVLISPDGRIIHRADGSRWKPEEFLNKLPPATP
ncbi:MAG: SCO family protein [Verrucomicrobiota bacterium]